MNEIRKTKARKRSGLLGRTFGKTNQTPRPDASHAGLSTSAVDFNERAAQAVEDYIEERSKVRAKLNELTSAL